MAKPITRACPIARYLRDYMESDIRAAKKSIWPKATFDVFGIAKTAAREAAILAKLKPPIRRLDQALHRSWETVDTRRSLACAFERERYRIAGLGLLRRVLHSMTDYDPSQPDSGWYFVTRVSVRHAVPPERTGDISVQKVMRPVVTGLRLLRTEFPHLIVVAAFELSYGRSLDGIVWAEPHVHFLVWGPSKASIESALRVPGLKPKNMSSLVVLPVTDDLDTRLSYILKMKGELRVQYVQNGRKRRRDNKLPPHLQARWLRFFVDVPVKEVLTLMGLPPDVVKQFHHGDLHMLVDELLRKGVGRRR